MKHILVIRLSALGDVAMLAPILKQRALENPEVRFTIAAPAMLKPLFEGVENLDFLPASKKLGVIELFKCFSTVRPTHVADMHHVNKVIGVCWLFRLQGIPVVAINKSRRDRRRLVRCGYQNAEPLTPVWKKYDAVFDSLGLNGKSCEDVILKKCPNKELHRVGIAPFAQHQGKIWPLEYMEQVVERLSMGDHSEVILFGSKEEAEILDGWASRYPNVVSLAGKCSFQEELEQIASLDVMLSMDSANMHFASCMKVPVVSIWGATHPAMGFYGFGQQQDWALQAPMQCRPCSAYGNKPCRFGDYRCMGAITPDMVLEKIDEVAPLSRD